MRRSRQHHVKKARGVRKVGFYGCANGVVRLGFLPEHEPEDWKGYPQVLDVPCPGCGHEHSVSPFWRNVVPKIDGNQRPDIALRRRRGRVEASTA